jgi:hypothetical protein
MPVPCTILEGFQSDWETRFYFYFIRLWAKRDPSLALKSGTRRDVMVVKLLFGEGFLF